MNLIKVARKRSIPDQIGAGIKVGIGTSLASNSITQQRQLKAIIIRAVRHVLLSAFETLALSSCQHPFVYRCHDQSSKVAFYIFNTQCKQHLIYYS